jgi:hypothetical protein
VGDLFKQRAGFNEATFREINEDIEEHSGDHIAFRCECARLGCNQLLELSRTQYEAVRAHPRRFVVLPGHELPEAEDVVERQDEYLVVEKRDAAGTVAERTDPRAPLGE